MNGSIGTVKEIVYDHPRGPKQPNSLPSYVVVDFPECTLGHVFIHGSPTTYIPIPVTTDRCERKCCTITTIPLRVCKAITIYKSQGLTVGDGKIWEKVVIWLPTGNQRKTVGTEVVAFSRATKPTAFAIGNDLNDIDRMSLLKIGKGKATKVRNDFEHMLCTKGTNTQSYYRDKISQLDISANKSFLGGCNFLLRWYRDKVNIRI